MPEPSVSDQDLPILLPGTTLSLPVRGVRTGTGHSAEGPVTLMPCRWVTGVRRLSCQVVFGHASQLGCSLSRCQQTCIDVGYSGEWVRAGGQFSKLSLQLYHL